MHHLHLILLISLVKKRPLLFDEVSFDRSTLAEIFGFAVEERDEHMSWVLLTASDRSRMTKGES